MKKKNEKKNRKPQRGPPIPTLDEQIQDALCRVQALRGRPIRYIEDQHRLVLTNNPFVKTIDCRDKEDVLRCLRELEIFYTTGGIPPF